MSSPSSLSIPAGFIAARLGRLAPLDARQREALLAAEGAPRPVATHCEIVAEGTPVCEPSIILSGWAYHSRIFADGRRQILGLLLPGDLIGMCRRGAIPSRRPAWSR